MIDELITYETAKLAKEVGFNEGTIYPTQSLLKRWLREKYDVHCCSEIYHDKKNRYLAIVYSDIYEKNNNDDEADYFETYEEALEDALFTGLTAVKENKEEL
jgi:hypothetical protein